MHRRDFIRASTAGLAAATIPAAQSAGTVTNGGNFASSGGASVLVAGVFANRGGASVVNGEAAGPATAFDVTGGGLMLNQGGGTFVRTADTEALVPPLAAAILRGAVIAGVAGFAMHHLMEGVVDQQGAY